MAAQADAEALGLLGGDAIGALPGGFQEQAPAGKGRKAFQREDLLGLAKAKGSPGGEEDPGGGRQTVLQESRQAGGFGMLAFHGLDEGLAVVEDQQGAAGLQAAVDLAGNGVFLRWGGQSQPQQVGELDQQIHRGGQLLQG